MKTDQLKKTNYVYVLGYVFIPLAVAALGLFIGSLYFHDGGAGAVVCMMGGPAAAILWWIFGGNAIYKLGKGRMLKQLDEAGFDRRQIFYSDGCVVAMDINRAEMALLFYWNPFAVQIAPASRVTRAWTDDGAAGPGVLRGTSRVSFVFEVDDIKIRVNTFISNQRWKMNDDKVLEGISKADLWVQVLDQASQQEAG